MISGSSPDKNGCDHLQVVKQIVEKELRQTPREIRRMTTGTANEVYAAVLLSAEVIVRLNVNVKSMADAEKHIALFQSTGISVPEMIASDYSRIFVPFAYQVQSKFDGRDIGDVFLSLTEEQLRHIAREVAFISRKLALLPTNGKFGWTGGGVEAASDSWLEVLAGMQEEVLRRNEQTGVVSIKYLDAMETILREHREYFLSVPSRFYYDDMSSKNVCWFTTASLSRSSILIPLPTEIPWRASAG
jgi:hypothetical protein